MKKNHDFLSLPPHSCNHTLYYIKMLVAMILVSGFSRSVFAAATCPTDQRMYYVGAAAPSTAYKSLPLSGWVEGSLTRTYTFLESTGNKTLTINFPLFLDKYTTYTSQPPYYGTLDGATLNAITIIHNSTAIKENHIMDVTVNRPVTRLGYVAQDVDSISRNGNSNGRVPYQEAVDVSSTAGTLTYQPNSHTINLSFDIVTSILRSACSGGSTSYACPIEATWGPKAANSPFSLTHSNQRSDYDVGHVLGYSDFYFCMAPPKLVVKKVLNGARVNNNDQFEIVVSEGSIATNSFTTTGTGSAITNGTSATLSLAESTSYTITERVINGTLGDIANYNATYTCVNTTTGSTTIMPTAAMSYDATAKTRSFTLANTAYGDDITCTITNESNYIFSGIVFNDNGGIVASDGKKSDISSTFTGNSNYFNGTYDSANELGIYDSNLSIRLTDCNGNNITSPTPNPQTVSNSSATRGRYSFIVPASALVNKTKVCLIETEPNTWDYTVDTTADSREVTLTDNVYNYNNLDFGEVKANNAALVLIKSQYFHKCNDSLDYQSISTNNSDPTVGFSMNSVSGAIPRNCIAYAIHAYNRGHLGLQQVQIRDQLQSNLVTSVFRRPTPLFLPTSVSSPIVTYGSNGEIRSNQFNLAAVPLGSTQPISAVLYFNTKYGTTP